MDFFFDVLKFFTSPSKEENSEADILVNEEDPSPPGGSKSCVIAWFVTAFFFFGKEVLPDVVC